jgi:diguanylate cyclase (GGDEF)-like protein
MWPPRAAVVLVSDAPRIETSAIRAIRAARAGNWDAAITEVATALAIGADQAPTRPLPGRARALGQLAETASMLGIHDLAECLARDAVAVAAGPTARTIAQHHLVRTRVLRALACQLERDDPAARTLLAAAVEASAAIDHSGDHQPEPDREASIVAAGALDEPGPSHLPHLFACEPADADDVALLVIAAVRCCPRTEPFSGMADVAGAARHPVLRLVLHHALEFGPGHPEPVRGQLDAWGEQSRTLRYAHATALRHALAHQRLRQAHASAVRDALTDPLTGLPNRRAAEDHLVAPADAVAAVAMIDLDRFKDVNDQHSHLAGDVVLRSVASCLRAHLREQYVLARVGGDEFLAILPDTAPSDALVTLRRAAAAVADRSDALGVTVSIGVAALLPGDDPVAALAAADAALYEAKRAGGNTAVSSLVPSGLAGR